MAHGETDPLAAEILDFWQVARPHAGLGKVSVVIGETVPVSVPPPAWSFGDNPQLANSLLGAVLDGRKTATSSALVEYDAEPLPRPGDLSIILDGDGHPRALVRTTSVDIVPFGEVDAEFAAAEGEDDGSLAAWRDGHTVYFERVLGTAVTPDLAVVCERFELRYPSVAES